MQFDKKADEIKLKIFIAKNLLQLIMKYYLNNI